MLAALVATLLLAAASAAAEPYVAARGGFQSWHDQSNRDQVESGSALGWSAELAVGDEAGLSDLRGVWPEAPKSDFALAVEAAIAARREELHGRNAAGAEHRSADGRHYEQLALTVNLWPGWQAARWLTLHVGGGAGIAAARALGDADLGWAALVGGGARVNLTRALSLEFAWRTVFTEAMRLDGHRATYSRIHGIVIGARWEFGQRAD